MKALDLIKGNEKLLLEEAVESKKIKTLSHDINELIIAMNSQIAKFAEFEQSELDGDFHYHAVVAKSLAEFFKGNKQLRVEDAVAKFENLEKQTINEYYETKNKLLSAINSLIKETAKEAAVSYYDLFEGELRRCEDGHEIIILGDRNNTVLRYIVEELDSILVVNGHFDQIESQGVDYNLEVLNRNVDLCTRKNNEVYGAKAGKLAKITSVIDKLQSVGEKVVAFYTYKDALTDIGCNPKGIKDYENTLSKEYIPLKKGLQKEFKIELENICDVVVNEDEYSSYEDFNMENTNNYSVESSSNILDENNYTNNTTNEEVDTPFAPAIDTTSEDVTTNTFEPIPSQPSFDWNDTQDTTNTEPISSQNMFDTPTMDNSFASQDNSDYSNTEYNPFNSFSSEVQNEQTQSNTPIENENNYTSNPYTNNSFNEENIDDEPSPFTSPLAGSNIASTTQSNEENVNNYNTPANNPFDNFNSNTSSINNNPFNNSNPFDN